MKIQIPLEAVVMNPSDPPLVKKNRGNVKHGYYGTPTYRSWIAMKSRCNDPKHPAYHRYGGRGIKVCKQWDDSFPPFLADVGLRPVGQTLNRTDNDSNYGPGLCCWSTNKEQGRNRITNHWIEFNGKKLTLVEWSEITGIKYTTLKERSKRGWSAEKILTEPVQFHRKKLSP